MLLDLYHATIEKGILKAPLESYLTELVYAVPGPPQGLVHVDYPLLCAR